MIRHISQTRTGNCGQTCVAMAARVTIGEVEAILGKRGGTWYADLRRALKHWGLELGRFERCRAKRPRLPAWALLMLRPPHKASERRRGHWILHWDGMVYDPELGGPVTLSTYFSLYLEARSITSFAEIS